MVMVLCFAAIGVGVVGWVLPIGSCQKTPASPCWTKVQNGFFTCTIAMSASSCSKTITFSPAYTVKPSVWTGWNGTVPIPSSTKTVTAAVDTTTLFSQTASTAWTVPIASTELNGATAQRTSFTTLSPWGSQTGQLCVDLVSTAGTAGFTAQSSPDQTTWTNLGTDGLTVFGDGTVGFKCSAVETTTLGASSLFYFRVMGSDSFGPAAATIGTVELILSGQSSPTTLTVPVACSNTQTTITSTTALFFVQCGNSGITLATLFTVNWWSGIPA